MGCGAHLVPERREKFSTKNTRIIRLMLPTNAVTKNMSWLDMLLRVVAMTLCRRCRVGSEVEPIDWSRVS